MKKVIKKVNKPIFIFVAGILSAIIIGDLFKNFYRDFIYKDTDDVILQEAKNSPTDYLTEQYTAISFVNMGGGAAGYCGTWVSVVPIKKFDEFQKAPYSLAYTTDCGADISLKWIDKTTLEISGIIDDEYNENKNSDGKVNIIYK